MSSPVASILPSSAPAAPVPPALRDFGDVPTIRRLIFDNAKAAATALPETTHQGYTLRLRDIDYDGPDRYTLAQQKRAVLSGRTLGRRLRGTAELIGRDGQVAEQRRLTLATIPYLTERGTYILNGTEQTLAHQQRLRPGVFARRKDNGELEAHVNILPGAGPSHRILLDPESGEFRVQFGQSKLPLTPLLSALGVTSQQLRDAWGPELALANHRSDDVAVVAKLAARVLRDDPQDARPVAERLRARMTALPLDATVMRHTLGQPYSQLSPEVYLDATRKLLAIHRGEADEDDRDHLAYQHVFGPEDLFAERVANSRHVLRQAMWRVTRGQRGLAALQPNLLTRSVHAAIMSSGLGQPNESINPAMIYEQQSRLTRLGEGGIPSLDSVPETARAVQPSQFAFIDPIWAPESLRVGVDSRVAAKVRKGADGRLYTALTDVKTGQSVYRSPQDLADSVIGFPGASRSTAPLVPAMVAGRPDYVPREQLEYELPAADQMFSPVSNLIPMKSGMKGQRAVMAGRMLTQALPLVDAEAPLVQNGVPGRPDTSFDDEFGVQMGAVRAPAAGRVVAASADEIVLQTPDGRRQTIELYNNFPNNRKTFYHQTAVVQPGDVVQPGQLLARSNYTDAAGTTALGRNARVAFLPFRSATFEDAVGVSESFARKLASEHMYQHELAADEHVKRGRAAYVAQFPTRLSRRQLDNYDDDGVIKIGATVAPDEPLILAVRQQPPMFNMMRQRRHSFSDAAVPWEHEEPGVVTDVEKTDQGVVVTVKSRSHTVIGDKLSGRSGNKGVIGEIIPDDEMPLAADGRPVEVLLNPQGITTRANPEQAVEAVLGKIAAAQGRPYKLVDFDKISDLRAFAAAELRKHGMQDKEDMTDPRTGRKIRGVLVGNMYFMKLHHQAASKGQGRGLAAYTLEGKPAKGGETGAKRISMQDQHALLSHGATEVMRDALVNRGQAHFDFWQRFMGGHDAAPEVPLVHHKFVEQLRGAGINVMRRGPLVHYLALTDADVDQLAGDRNLENADTVDWREGLKPRRGGLFDPGLTGGHAGRRWAALRLHEPMPSPAFEEPIRKLLGLTEQQFLDVLAGRSDLHGVRGPRGIAAALDRLDLPREMTRARAEIAAGKRTKRDAAVRRLAYLKAADAAGIHPRQWVLQRVPVLPPAFRPVSAMSGNGLPLVSDANYLYKDLFTANANLADMSQRVDDVGEERLAVYNAFKAVTGLGDPVSPRASEKRLKGLLAQVVGNSPKTGMVQRSLLSSSTDLVGRAVIVPDSRLTMDEVGLPEDRAWELYQPFIVRRLVRRGLSRLAAVQAAKERTPLAKREMLDEMAKRPVLINRAPVLHRYGIMAFWPKLVTGSAMHTSPLVISSFGGDYDGDAMQYHVPFSDGAVQDAVEKMLPSRNLLTPGDFKVHQLPGKEFLAGLYHATTAKRDATAKVYATLRDVVAAYQRGDLEEDAPVHILRED